MDRTGTGWGSDFRSPSLPETGGDLNYHIKHFQNLQKQKENSHQMKFRTNFDLKFKEGSVYTRNSQKAAIKGPNYVSPDAYINARPAEYQSALERSSIAFKMDTSEKDNKFITNSDQLTAGSEGKLLGYVFDKQSKMHLTQQIPKIEAI